MIQCNNLKPTDFGLKSTTEVQNPFSVAPSVSFPFPQLLRGSGVTLLAYEDTVEEVDESDWSTSVLATYDLYDSITPKAITGGGLWHFVDCAECWLLLNGVSTVLKTKKDTLFGTGSDKVYVEDSIDISTGCNFRGVIFLGGFNSSNFWSTGWQQFWDVHRTDLEERGLYLNLSADSNHVMWTSVGGAEILNLFFPDLATEGYISGLNYSTADAFFFDLVLRNSFGILPMPHQGEVQCLKPLGKMVVSYGDDGINALVPMLEPVATWGLHEIASLGVAGRGAIGGDSKNHIFIDDGGHLWVLGSNLEPERLGYQEYLAEMVGTDISISYDAEERDFYISNSELCYVFNRNGLCRHGQSVTSSVFLDGGLIGVAKSVPPELIEIQTDILDPSGSREINTIHLVELGLSAPQTVEAALEYRLDHGRDFTRTNWVLVNPDGIARLQAVGIDFRVVARAPKGTNLELDYVRLTWSLDGKKSLRDIFRT